MNACALTDKKLMCDYTKVSILIVEDDQIDRMSLERYCNKRQLAFNSVENGVEALHALYEQDYAVVLSDIDMPGMDGTQLVNEIRNFAKNRIPVIIAISGNQQLQLEEQYKNFGFDYFIPKPADPKILDRILIHGRKSPLFQHQ